MYSKDSGTSWDIVAQNVGLSDYRVNDFVWYVINKLLISCNNKVHMSFFILGVNLA